MSSGYVKLSGMVWTATEQDVRNLLGDCNVSQVHFIMNYQGKPTGDGLVKLTDKNEVPKALAHNRQMIGRRFVIIDESDEEIFNYAVSEGKYFPCFLTLYLLFSSSYSQIEKFYLNST